MDATVRVGLKSFLFFTMTEYAFFVELATKNAPIFSRAFFFLVKII